MKCVKGMRELRRVQITKNLMFNAKELNTGVSLISDNGEFSISEKFLCWFGGGMIPGILETGRSIWEVILVS